MRQILVGGKFDDFRVHQNQLHLIRRARHQQAGQHRIHAYRFAGTRRAGDQQVRHIREVGDDRPPADVLAQRQWQRRRRVVPRIALH